MKKIIGLTAIVLIGVVVVVGYFIMHNNNDSTEEVIEGNSIDEDNVEEEGLAMRILVSDGTHRVTYELNDSGAARSLYEQLPLTLEVENFSSNEKIFYPTNELEIDNTPQANGGDAGVLAYYEPWGDVVMFYDSFSSASGLYELGHAVEGVDQIEDLSLEITVEKLENE